MNMLRHQFPKWILLLLLLLISVTFVAEIPAGYYRSAEGKKEAELKTALFNIIKHHVQLEYYASSTYFRTTDWHPDGYFWDMYSRNQRTTWTGLNREHALPKSWWSTQPENTVAYSDLHNLYPSEPTANSEKSNYPLGEVGSQFVYDNGMIRVGTSSFSGYSGTVFEPSDEYKGDFARTYMYMVTAYEDYASNWRSLGTASMLFNNTYPVFKPYAVNLLLKWHRNDPVSQKEINRNNAVFTFQQNRNPFIDHPVLAEFIWGHQRGQTWDASLSGYIEPESFHVTFRKSTKSLIAYLKPAASVPYSIFSTSGQLLRSGTLSPNVNTNLNVSDLPHGTYLIMVETPLKKHVKMFLLM